MIVPHQIITKDHHLITTIIHHPTNTNTYNNLPITNQYPNNNNKLPYNNLKHPNHNRHFLYKNINQSNHYYNNFYHNLNQFSNKSKMITINSLLNNITLILNSLIKYPEVNPEIKIVKIITVC